MSVSRRLLIAAVAGFALSVSATAFAQEHGTKEEAQALAQAAAAHVKKVGLDKAAKDFASDKAKWAPKDLFPFVQEFSGVMRYHASEKLIGRDVGGVKDASGKAFGAEMINIAKTKGTGWVDYEYVNPATKKVADKTGYIVRVEGQDLLVGVGYYR